MKKTFVSAKWSVEWQYNPDMKSALYHEMKVCYHCNDFYWPMYRLVLHVWHFCYLKYGTNELLQSYLVGWSFFMWMFCHESLFLKEKLIQFYFPNARGITQLKEHECQIAVEDVMYMLIFSKLRLVSLWFQSSLDAFIMAD